MAGIAYLSEAGPGGLGPSEKLVRMLAGGQPGYAVSALVIRRCR